MFRVLTSSEPVAFLPLPNLAAFMVISCRAFEVAIEPEPKRTILHHKRAGQNVFTINLSTSSVSTSGIASIIAVNPVAGAFNQLCSLCETSAISCGYKRCCDEWGSAEAHFNPHSSFELNARQRGRNSDCRRGCALHVPVGVIPCKSRAKAR